MWTIGIKHVIGHLYPSFRYLHALFSKSLLLHKTTLISKLGGTPPRTKKWWWWISRGPDPIPNRCLLRV